MLRFLTRSLLLSPLLFLLVADASRAQQHPNDGGVQDSFIIKPTTLYVGQSVPVEIRITNDAKLEAIGYAYLWRSLDSGWATFDSIVYSGRLADPRVLDARYQSRSNIDGQDPDLFFAAVIRMGEPVTFPPGSDQIARIYMTGQRVGSIRVDTVGAEAMGGGGAKLKFFQSLFLPGHSPWFAPTVLSIAANQNVPQLSATGQLLNAVAGESVTIPFSLSGEYTSVTVEAQLADNGSSPEIRPSVNVTGEPQIHWIPAASDAGYWNLTITACKESACSSVKVEIQIAAQAADQMQTEIHTIPGNGLDGQVLSVADVDANGDLEVLWLGREFLPPNRAIRAFDADPSGSLLEIDAYTTMAPAQGFAVGYLDADAYPDCVGSFFNGYSNEVREFHGTGSGLGNATTMLTPAHSLRQIALGELTEDGKLDIISYNPGSQLIELQSRNSFDEWNLVGTLPIGSAAASLKPIDLNADSHTDLVAALQDELVIYLGDGTGTLTKAASYPSATRLADVDATTAGADLNGDGIVDLIVGAPPEGSAQTELISYLGNGDGTFVVGQRRSFAGQIYATALTDVDQDNLIDVVYVNTGRKLVGIAYGNGDGTFGRDFWIEIPDFNPVGIVAGDFDSDNDADFFVLATSFPASGSLYLIKNLSTQGSAGASPLIAEISGPVKTTLRAPSGMYASEIGSTIPSASHQYRSIDGDQLIDQQLSIATMESGEYRLGLGSNASSRAPFSIDLRRGNSILRLAKNQTIGSSARSSAAADAPALVFYAPGSSPVTPEPGAIVSIAPAAYRMGDGQIDPDRFDFASEFPTLSWAERSEVTIEIASDFQFTSVIERARVTGSYKPRTLTISADTLTYYWRLSVDGVKFGDPFALSFFSPSADADSGDVQPPTDEEDQPPSDDEDQPPSDDEDQPPSDEVQLPTSVQLDQNYPNPFNPTTTIRFALPTSGSVELTIHDLLGRTIRTVVSGLLPAGEHAIDWDGHDQNGNAASSGVYFYRLRGDGFSLSRKMMMLK